MKKSTQKPATKAVPLSTMFSNTPLEKFFKDVEASTQAKKDQQRAKFGKPTPLAEAGSCFSHVFGDVFSKNGFPEFSQQTATPDHHPDCEDCDDCTEFWGAICGIKQSLENASHLSRILETQLASTNGRPFDNHRVSALLVELQAQVNDGIQMAESALDAA